MIKKSTMYNMICDGCGRELDEQYWNDPEVVTDNANEANWKQIDGKDYCPDCYKYDDNDSVINIEIRKDNPKPKPKSYEIETLKDILDAVNSDNIDNFLSDFESVLRAGILAKAIDENVKLSKITWIDD